MVFDIYVEDEECLATLELLETTCPEYCAIGVNDALEEAKGMAEDEVKVAFGTAKSMIDIVPATPTTIFDAQLRAMAQYSSAIEWNTSPHFPPLEALMPWAQLKNDGRMSDASFAYVVRAKIGEAGTSGKPFIAYLADEKLPALLEIHLMISLEAWEMSI